MTRPQPQLQPAQHPFERLPEEWAEILRSWDEPSYRGLQIFRWIHRRGVLDPEHMSDLSKSLREKLIADQWNHPCRVTKVHASPDATRKLLVSLSDQKSIETVLIPQLDKQDLNDEDFLEQGQSSVLVPGNIVTQCISSQVGCAMGCVFCASGVAGLDRHLTAAEIISQILVGRMHLTENERIRNIVLMGMGEPLHNYDNVARALVLMTHPEGLALSSRRVTLSTSGLVPAIDRLGRDFNGQVALAISLHAVDDAQRSSIMPVNRKYPLKELVAALKRYPMPKRRRITIEYTMIKNVNDKIEDANALAQLMKGIAIKVNLIPMNPIDDQPLQAPDRVTVENFQKRLLSYNISCFIRRQRGATVDAACGQLALQENSMPRRKNRNLPVFN